LEGPLFNLLGRHNLIDKTNLERFGRRYESCCEDNFLRSSWPDEVDQAGVAGHREAIAKRPCDWNPELRLWCTDSQVTRHSDHCPTANRIAPDHRNHWLPDHLESANDPIHHLFVVERVLWCLELEELADI